MRQLHSCSHAYLVLFGISVFSKLKYSIAWLINITVLEKKRGQTIFSNTPKNPSFRHFGFNTVSEKKRADLFRQYSKKRSFRHFGFKTAIFVMAYGRTSQSILNYKL
jgi:hypothetical protein